MRRIVGCASTLGERRGKCLSVVLGKRPRSQPAWTGVTAILCLYPVTQECTKANKRIDLQPFTAYDNQNSRNAGVIRTHVTVSVSVRCVLFAGHCFSGASNVGWRDGVGHVIYERRGLVERERGAEIGSRVLRRHVADSGGCHCQHSIQRIERDGTSGLAGEVRWARR